MVGGRPPEETSGGTETEASRYVDVHFLFRSRIRTWAIERPTEWGTELLRVHVLSIEQDSWIFESDEGF